MRSGVLQQVASPRELYADPRNLFVAGFIGSPAMNFFGGELVGQAVRTPLGELPLPDALRRSVERHGGSARQVVVGIRPEDFEDAALAADPEEGYAFEAPVELTESMGSEIYAHFSFEGQAVRADELRELEEDSGGADIPHRPDEGGSAVARLDPQSDARAGQRAKLWVDLRHIHLFDAKTGNSLTHSHDVETKDTAATQ
jgi:multiple sugar transport system ATP-binding protein